MIKRSALCLLLLLSPCFSVVQGTSRRSSADPSATLPLRDGWLLQSSRKVDEPGETVSSTKFHPVGWYGVSVPTTVLAALIAHHVYLDPDYGMNLRSIPGTTYPVGANFSNFPMRQDSPFMVPWWYRKEFTLPEDYAGKTIWLDFGGINYRANVWLNGKQIADYDRMAGTWRTWDFNVTGAALPGKTNVLAIEVFSPLQNDLAITFVDWSPLPPDKDMGLFREVEIRASGPVALRYPAVVSKVDSLANDRAHLTVTVLVKNASSQPIRGMLKGQIENIEFSQDLKLSPNESRNVTFTADRFPQLNLSHPRLWWPAQMGTPNLYGLLLEFDINGRISDRAATQFGVREITSELNSVNGRLFSINGKRILIRGGGWAQDMMMRQDHQRLEDEFRYVQDMGLNTIRLEDHLETEDFFNLADRKGVLIMAGWICCSPWEHWPTWQPEDFTIASESLRSQIYRLRSHPSLLAWFNGSDNPPPPDIEETYLKIENELSWPNPVVSSATAARTEVTGDPGMKMTGPYNYVAPKYWLEDTPSLPKRECNPGGCGGAYGFNSETSMGPAPPPLESLRAMLPTEHLWPIDDWWTFHAGGENFTNMHVFEEGLSNRYGVATGADDFAMKSQAMAYEGVRAMYEAYSRNKYTSTGVIQWMLNNAWPSMIWHLYDYYLRPGGGYFGAKKALEALHPLYGYDDHSVWVVSSQYQDARDLKVMAEVLNLDMTEKFSQQAPLDAPADSTTRVLTLPEIDGLSSTYFLVLRLEDANGKLVGSNFYWLSTKPETLDWQNSTEFVTPTLTFADFTALSQLPKVRLNVTSRTERQGADSITHVTVENPTKNLAFFARMKVDKSPDGEEILPVIWEDNYISLLPGEKREITATYRASLPGSEKPTVVVSGWNIK